MPVRFGGDENAELDHSHVGNNGARNTRTTETMISLVGSRFVVGESPSGCQELC